MAVIGIDLGGTKLAGVLLSDDGTVVDQTWIAHTISRDRNAVVVLDGGIAQLEQSAAASGHPVHGVGVSIAGWLDSSRAYVVHAANLALSGVALKDQLEAHHQLPVYLGNDGDCTLLGEQAVGAAQGCANAVLLTLGTGVGGAVLAEGRLLVGSRGAAGELGHIPVVPGDQVCVCGGRGCLEQQVSGAALGRVAARLAADSSSPWLAAVSGPVGARDLGDAARAGDGAARTAIDLAAEALAAAVRILIPVTNPEVVVLGGSVIEGLGDLLVPAVVELLGDEAHPLAVLYAAPRIVTAAAKNAAAIGAAQLVTRQCHPGEA